LVKHADVNVADSNGMTPLHYAVRDWNDSLAGPDNQLIIILLQAGANPRLQDKNGKSPLDIASDIGRRLLENEVKATEFTVESASKELLQLEADYTHELSRALSSFFGHSSWRTTPVIPAAEPLVSLRAHEKIMNQLDGLQDEINPKQGGMFGTTTAATNVFGNTFGGTIGNMFGGNTFGGSTFGGSTFGGSK
jgi:hypothetical protein